MYIGIDLGGTNIACGLVNAQAKIVIKHAIPTGRERGSDAVIADMCALIDRLCAEAPGDDPVTGIGIGIPGIADPVTGNVKVCVNLGWYNVPLKAKIAEQFDLPIFIDNDATIAGVAEFFVAQEGKYRDAIMLTLGTGVGGALLVDGKMISGYHGIGSEVGHMIVDASGGLYRCNCGRVGCLETFASSTAIIDYAKRLISKPEAPKTMILDLANGDLNQIDGRIIFEAAEAGDETATEVVNRLVHYLGIGISNLITVLDPEIFLLGGGIAMAGEFLLDRLNRELDTYVSFKESGRGRIELAKLKNDAGIIGAAMYAQIQDRIE
ncbi:MAG: glucokinase [Clostridiales bacterium]|nr:glucokinase [Clostridiales bacterium]